MFLLKIYLAISVLCLGTIIGCRMVFADSLRRFKGEKKKRKDSGTDKIYRVQFHTDRKCDGGSRSDLPVLLLG